MPENIPFDEEKRGSSDWTAARFLTSPVCAVAAFTLAVVTLMGPNLVTVGISALLGPVFDSGSATAFYVGYGVAAAVQVGLVLLLARRTFDAEARWESVLGRTAVLVAGVALAGAALVIVGTALNGGQPGY